ncbi:MAG: XTP/dITP diphosphatase [Desulfobacterales bacterium]|nr:XTP/dITP diphosphatase [Desulfobacterales bacterium]
MKNVFTLVIATGNKGKTLEIRRLLDGFPVQIKDLGDYAPIPPVTEDGNTFEENACKKASFAARMLGLPALADDSGLMVEALDGAPGVLSARYAGKDTTDEQRCKVLLKEMGDRPHRKATFVCAVCITMPRGLTLTFRGTCDGLIAAQPAGSNGFGYDPVFYYPPMQKTFAEMTLAQKSTVSHRGKALKALCDSFDRVQRFVNTDESGKELS